MDALPIGDDNERAGRCSDSLRYPGDAEPGGHGQQRKGGFYGCVLSHAGNLHSVGVGLESGWTAAQEQAADVDGNGIVDSTDVVLCHAVYRPEQRWDSDGMGGYLRIMLEYT